jgi:cysteine desulfurase
MFVLHINRNAEILAQMIAGKSVRYCLWLRCHMYIAFPFVKQLISMTPEIYLDANATSAVLPAAIEAADGVMRSLYGNPSSTHATGLQARAMLDGVRALARRVVGAGNGSLVFTSGATESIQTAILSALVAVREKQARGEAVGDLLVYGATEHKAVPESLAHWNTLLGTGLTLCALPVDFKGQHRLDVLRECAPQAAMVCTMAANNETGAVSDLDGIAAVLAETGSAALWMVDSVQALGKLDLDLAATRIDYAPFSGHKLYAPKGVGMLYVREGAPFTPLMAGGGQEGGLRSGTENMAAIAALGAVLAALERGGTFRSHEELAGFRARVADTLRMALPGVVFNAPFDATLPTTLNFSVPGLSSRELLDLFDAGGIRVSAGSACSSAKAAPSYVLQAMGVPEWRCAAAVRMSFGPTVDEAFIDAACERIARCGQALRAAALVPSGAPVACAGGVVQLHDNGACCSLVLDAASRAAIVIDPLPALCERIATVLACHGYLVHAIVDTDAAAGDGHARLLARLGEQYQPRAASSIVVGDGSTAACIEVGGKVLAQCAGALLLGVPRDGTLAAADVQYAFTGKRTIPVDPALPLAQLRSAVQRLAALVHADTLLCPSLDPAGQFCSTPAAEAQGASVLAELLAMQPRLARAALPAMDSVLHLEASALERFLRTHPDALLVDVREPHEHAAGAASWQGRLVASVPLSRLVSQLPQWLAGEQRPLVFFCRSGNRSARAAQCLHRLGYPNAWSIAGGVALGLHSENALALAA